MANQLPTTQPTVVLGIQFGPAAKEILETTRDLCLRMNARLRLVHAIEPWFGTSWTAMALQEPSMVDLYHTYEGQSLTQAGELLQKLAKDLPKELQVTTNVILGRAPDAIISEAIANTASLVVTGASSTSHRFVPKGLSTALSLMADSPIPVLVITEGTKLQWNRPDLRMMIADDLGENSLTAIQNSYRWAEKLAVKSIYHCHINSLSPELLKSSLETALATAHNTNALAIPPQEIFQNVVKSLDKKLKERSAAAKPASSTIAVETAVKTGEIAQEIGKTSKDCHADILTFGRHHTIHRHPFYIGRFPFSAMLGEGKPVLIIPSVG